MEHQAFVSQHSFELFGSEDADFLSRPIKQLKDKFTLVPAYLKTRGLVVQQIDSFDLFVNSELPRLVVGQTLTVPGFPGWGLRYTRVSVSVPSTDVNMISQRLTPDQCRLRNLTYSAPIRVDVEVSASPDGPVQKMQDIRIGRLPIMLRSQCCATNGQSVEARKAAKAECPHDPGGYFIIKGVEKAMLMQEELQTNRVLVLRVAPRNDLEARVTSWSGRAHSRTTVTKRNDMLYLNVSMFEEPILLPIVFYALGVTVDSVMFELCGPEADEFIANSVMEARRLQVFNRRDALAFLVERVRRFSPNSRFYYPKQDSNNRHDLPPPSALLAWLPELIPLHHPHFGRYAEVLELLANKLLVHVPVREYDLRPKAHFLGYMVRRLVLVAETGAHNQPEQLDDKDFFGHKRVLLAGDLLAAKFTELFRAYNRQMSKIVRKALTSSANGSVSHAMLVQEMEREFIGNGLTNALATGNWSKSQIGVSQVLNRYSYVSMLGMLTRVMSQFEKSRKTSGPRALHPSTFGRLCPSDTPEGESCGLVKSLALFAQVSRPDVEGAAWVSAALYHFGTLPPYVSGMTTQRLTRSDLRDESVVVRDFDAEDDDEAGLEVDVDEDEEKEAEGDDDVLPRGVAQCLVLLNGRLMGTHSNPARLCRLLRRLRRGGRLPIYTSVAVERRPYRVHVRTDAGRVCRPLVVVEEGRPLVQQRHLDRLGRGLSTFEDLIRDGLVEFIDTNEETSCFVAVNEDAITEAHTHMELEPVGMLGVVAGIIPFPHHNQSPRITYQCAMGKQSASMISYSQLQRIDGLQHLMQTPQRPLVMTRVTRAVGNLSEFASVQNAVIAVMSFTGFDLEDAIIMNKASVERGLARVTVYKRSMCTLEQYPNQSTDRLVATPGAKGVESDGLVGIGAEVSPGSVLVARQTPVNKERILPEATPPQPKPPSDGDDEGQGSSSEQPQPQPKPQAPLYTPNFTTVKQTEGDSRVDRVMITSGNNGGVLIKVLLRSSRPPEVGDKFSSRHGQKGVVGALVAQEDMPFTEQGIVPDVVVNPHGFPSRMTVGNLLELQNSKRAALARDLVEAGYSCTGKEMLTSGATGETLEAYIFMGPVAHQRLRHMVADKMHARSRGRRAMLTRQPTDGRAKGGGLRLGEMERDCLIAYGSSEVLLERLLHASDRALLGVCSACGVVLNVGEMACNVCQGQTVETLSMPYACKVLMQELVSMGIRPRIKTESFGEPPSRSESV